VFNLQGSEIIVILLVALVVLGPEKLPEAVRRASRTYHELKKMGTSFQSELKAAIDEPMREMRETADLVRDAADPRKFTEQESRPAGESRPVPPSADTEAPAGPVERAEVEAAEDDAVMGEMWEDDPALDPGSTTIGTPPPRPARDDEGADDGGDAEGPAPDTTDRPAQ
jgi:sec-independent protein translocase protein TatB